VIIEEGFLVIKERLLGFNVPYGVVDEVVENECITILWGGRLGFLQELRGLE
jgi:hypothetical protein